MPLPDDFKDLDPTVIQNAIQGRLRDLEAQYLQVQLRIQAPALSEPVGGTPADLEAAELLKTSISSLQQLLAEVSG